ncbi:DsbA family protein [Pseudomonas aeruginosa]|uniref:DsbA family protein n=1 Tax=Pseudomonas aeruginosa TaxID=287 RepID=UPI001EDEA26E|nr:DsbA family protein [Pseudomonas aeruginosa]
MPRLLYRWSLASLWPACWAGSYTARPVRRRHARGPEVAQAHPAGPPWRRGPANARFTLTRYANLECPFCKAYCPTLMARIDAHPEASLRWHHLPLAMHDPEAIRLARVAECAGEAKGQEASPDAIAWLSTTPPGAMARGCRLT